MTARNYELKCRVTKEEYEKVKLKCKRAGVPIAIFLRHLALKGSIKIQIDKD